MVYWNRKHIPFYSFHYHSYNRWNWIWHYFTCLQNITNKNGLLNLIIGIILALLFSTAAEMLIAALTTKMFELASWLEYVNPYLQAIAGPLAFSACAMISAGNNRNWIYVITVSFILFFL